MGRLYEKDGPKTKIWTLTSFSKMQVDLATQVSKINIEVEI